MRYDWHKKSDFLWVLSFLDNFYKLFNVFSLKCGKIEAESEI